MIFNKTKNKFRTGVLLALFTFPLFSVCQNTTPQTANQGNANPLLWFMIFSILLLALAIAGLGGAIRNIIGISRIRDEENKKREEESNKSNVNKTLGLFLLFTMAGHLAFSGNIEFTGAEDIGGLSFGTFYFLLAIIIIELIFLAVLANVMKGLLEPYRKMREKLGIKKEKTIIEKLNDSVDIEKERDILLDHDYDGIKELDNNLPPWWKYGFYLTIVFALIYLVHYHITETGDLQTAELKKDFAVEDAKIAEYLKNSANNVDENTVKLLDNPADIAAGKDLYLSKPCKTCHGEQLQGGIGPNLTDDYWIHGGSVKDIFKSLKYGWPEKGMQPWKDELSPMQIAQITSYIKSLRGSNPAGGKNKEGELFIEEGASPAATDSTTTATDTLKIPAADTLKK